MARRMYLLSEDQAKDYQMSRGSNIMDRLPSRNRQAEDTFQQALFDRGMNDRN